MPVREGAEQREVRVAVGDLPALLAQPGDGVVALLAQLVDLPEQLRCVPQRRERDRLGDRGVLIREVGPDGWLRVSIGTAAEMVAFKEALTQVTEEETS